MRVEGIDWGEGNWPKCGKHGVGESEVEDVLRNLMFRIPDPFPEEPRYRTAGQATTGRHVFLVFAQRERDRGTFLRPISARYMHDKEIRKYEQFKKTMAKPSLG
jgi:uncharacterized DUF497 family protein